MFKRILLPYKAIKSDDKEKKNGKNNEKKLNE